MPKSSGRSIIRTSTYFLIAFFGGISELVESAKGLKRLTEKQYDSRSCYFPGLPAGRDTGSSISFSLLQSTNEMWN